jgi:cell division protein FtsZ
MSHMGTVLIGIGIASGEGRTAEAVQKAINIPLIEVSINGAQGVIMNIIGGSNLSLYEVQEVADLLFEIFRKCSMLSFSHVDSPQMCYL